MFDLEARPGSMNVSEAVIRHCLQAFSHVRLRVTGLCMLPALVPGMTVLVGRTESHPPRLGDVVLVRHPAGLRLHRLIWGPPLASNRSMWRTKPDRAVAPDPWIPPEHVLGTVFGIEGTPGGGPGLHPWVVARWMGASLLRRFGRRLKRTRGCG